MDLIIMILIQSISAIAFIFLITSFKKRNKKQIIGSQIISSFLFTIHYFLLNAFSGAVTSFIILLRNILFHKYKRHEKKLSIIFMGLFVISGLIFFDKWYSVLPVIGGCVYTYKMTKRKKDVLLGAAVNSASWAIYNIFARSYVGIFAETMVVIFSLKALKKMK